VTQQQVERAYPNFEEFDKPIAGEWSKVFGLKSYIAGGCEFTMDLGFYDNHELTAFRARARSTGRQPMPA
jgi:hypothetical protein